MLTTPQSKDWLTYRANYASWGYSELPDIDTKNVSSLTLAWTYSMDAGWNEGTPVVHDGVLFLPHPNDVIEAIDARSGEQLWRYQRSVPADLNLPNSKGGTLSLMLHSVKRNIAIYGERIYTIAADATLVALNARDGSVAWETKIGDYHEMVSTTGPIVADGKVITVRSCDVSFGGGCFVAANDAGNGKELWRRYFIPRPGEPGDETWNGLPLEKRAHVGAWGIPSFDAETGLLYVGTSVPQPSVEVIRGTVGADMLYSNSTLALDIKTGKIVWYFQHLPRDNWDMDHVFERILVDAPQRPESAEMLSVNPDIKAGQVRNVLTGVPGKTGIIWTLDRRTGEYLWSRPTVKQNFVTAVNPRTGRPTVNPALILASAKDRYPTSCPSVWGGKNYMPAAYSPRTRSMFLPVLSSCQEITVTTLNPEPADSYGLDFAPKPAESGATLGWLQAVSVETGKTLWTHKQPGRVMSVLATAGDVVFAGDTVGRFMAFDAGTGRILWATQLHATVGGAPVSYSANGVQYIAVTAGGPFPLADANRLSGLPYRGNGNMLYVFRLPPSAPSPTPLIARPMTNQNATGLKLEMLRVDAESGASSYAGMCAGCHGAEMRGSGHAPGMTGCGVTSRWKAKNISEYMAKIEATMPPGAPQRLDRQTAANIVGHWLKVHGAGANLVGRANAWAGTPVDSVVTCDEGKTQ